MGEIMLKYKNKKGEEVEIEETEVITAIKEEYEKKLSERDASMIKLKNDFEKEKENMRQEHVKQMRAILTGRKEDATDKQEFEEDEKTEEEVTLESAKKYLGKL